MIQSTFSNAFFQFVSELMSPTEMHSKSLLTERESEFLTVPQTIKSNLMSSLHKACPINPEAPVTKIFFICFCLFKK